MDLDGNIFQILGALWIRIKQDFPLATAAMSNDADFLLEVNGMCGK